MSKEVKYGLIFAGLGVALSIIMIIILLSIARPYFEYKMPVPCEVYSLRHLQEVLTYPLLDWSIKFLGPIVIIIALIMIVRALNPHIRFPPKPKGAWRVVMVGITFSLIPFLLGYAIAYWLRLDLFAEPISIGYFIPFAAIGAIFWLIWSKEGWAGDLSSLSYKGWRNLHLQGKIALLGIIAGGIVSLAAYIGERILSILNNLIFLTAGVFLGGWLMFIFGSSIIAAIFGFVVGVAMFNLTQLDIPWRRRLRQCMPGLIVVAGAFPIGLGLYYGLVVGYYDYGKDLGSLLGIPARSSATRTILVFSGKEKEPVLGTSELLSSGLDASEESARKVWKYLTQRHYRTAKCREAFDYLRDST